MTVKCLERFNECLPAPRVLCGFAREVAGIELLEGGVDVVGGEYDVRREPVVGVDFDNADHLVIERLARSVLLREAKTTKGEAVTARRNGVARYVHTTDEIGHGLQVLDFGVPALPDAGIHWAATIVTRIVTAR